MKKKLSKKYIKILFLILILIQLLFCIWMGHMKRGFFCDEIFSYGLANSQNYTFLDSDSSKNNSDRGWVKKNYFEDYVEVNDGEQFNFSAAIKNQINDVHPPLYYILLHLVCSLVPNVFTKWTGLGLNLFVLLLIDYLLFYFSKFIFKGDIVKAILVVAFWSMSAAGISNILFIRMYLLQTMELLSYIVLHIYIFRKQKDEFKFRIRDLIFIMINVIIGGLTHYYYYPFIFFFSAPICLWLLIKRDIINLLKYICALCGGFIINLVLFPATIDHIFSGYRGTQVAENLKNRNEHVFRDYYLEWINNSLVGGLLKYFLIIFAISIIVKLVLKFYKIKFIKRDYKTFRVQWEKRNIKFIEITFDLEQIIYLLSVFSAVAFAYIAIIGSDIKSNRYIYPIFPIFTCIMISVLFCVINILIKDGKLYLIVGSVLVGICICTYYKYGIDYQYSDYDEIEKKAISLKKKDCLLYYGEEWLDVYTALPLKFVYDETYYFNPNEITSLNLILKERESCDEVVVSLPSSFTEEKTQNVLNGIVASTTFSKYEMIYNYCQEQVYSLY